MPRLLKGFLVFFFLLFLLFLLEILLPKVPLNKKVAVVKLDGVIDEAKKEEFFELLKEAINRDDVVGIVISINSPGGAVVPSQEIYDFIMKSRSKKPIYSYISSIGASGAYYVASSTERIYVEKGSLVGSIGVIFTIPEIGKLAEKLGIKMVTIKSGRFKDTGNPFKDMTEEEKKYIESLVMNVYEQFVEDVARARKISVDELRKLADGRVFTGVEAKRLKLVDEVGTLDDAVSDLSRRLGYSKPLEVIFIEKKKKFLDELMSTFANVIVGLFREMITGGVR
ncbi:MAG: signal peptide peptidase SppA [Thermosulfidibacteraceae bacterium]|jgi:protease-4